MANVEVIEPEVINAEFVDNIAPESRFAQEVQNRGIPPVDLGNIDPELLYQTAEQYEIAAQKMEDMRDGFAQQALQTEQERRDLELLYEKSAKPFGATETTAATIAGAVLLPEAVKFVSKNVYNHEKMAQDGLNAAVNTMGKNPNWNPLNWKGNLFCAKTVGKMQDNVEAAVQRVSGGDNLAKAITAHTDDMIQAAGIDGQTQRAFNKLDKNFIKISKLASNDKLFDKAEGLINNVTNKLTSEMNPELHDLSSSISTVDPLNKTKGVLLQSVELSYEDAKDAARQAVQGDAKVHGHLLGNAQEIKQQIIEGVSNANSGRDGMEVLAEKAKKDLDGNKIAEGIMWGRDKFKNARPEVQTAIVASGIVISGILSYLAASEISKRRQENLNHIDGQIVATEDKKEGWIQRVSGTENNRIEAIKASSKIREIADWKTKIAQEDVSIGGKGF